MQRGKMIFKYRVHAIQRIFERDISEEDVQKTVLEGRVIESYPDDMPYPSILALGYTQKGVLHVVYAKNKSDNTIIVITAYRPDPEKWNDDYTIRKNR
jgi:predicted neuraminidase